MSEEKRYAVLIDAENISGRYIKIIMDEIANYGVVTYRRIYGDWTNTRNNSWKDVLLEHSVTPIQQYSYTLGKNASDSAMIIDAMDIMYSGTVDGFCLASSDSDFTRLAARLREYGMNVIGMGESKTPSAFIAACNQFKYLDILYEDSGEETEEASEPEENRTGGRDRTSSTTMEKKPERRNRRKPGSQETGEKAPFKGERPQPQTKLKTIRKALTFIVEEGTDEEGWMLSSIVGNQLAKRFPDFDVRNYGYKQLTKFIESLGDFEVERIAEHPGSKVQQVYIRKKEDKAN